MAEKKKSWISIMIVPEDGTGVRNWRISTRRYALLKGGLWMVAFLLLAGAASFLALVYMSLQLRETKIANTKLIEAASKIELIAGRLADYENKEKSLRAILGGDLSIPEPLTVDQITTKPLLSSGDSGSLFEELDSATKRAQSRMRRIPNIWPVDAWQITKEYNDTGNPRTGHFGIDIISWENSPVVSSADGTVIFADIDPALGQLIRIDHGNGWISEYGHNSQLFVKYGLGVKKGQTIAIFGGADNSGSGPHLHYALFYNKKPVNPLDYLEPKSKLKMVNTE
ncbi:M23 family metallopeptidase [Candidatus Latescibacterota bacterium]